ncbi:MAG TPA: glycosyltransferase family 4 protein [Allosphingosinicella sp.]
MFRRSAASERTGSTIFVVGARGIPDVEGGVEKNSERLFPLLVEKGWKVVLAGLQQHIRSDSYRGVQLVSAPSSRFFKTDKLLYYIRAVFIARRIRPDVVHMQGLGAAIMLWAYKFMGVKTVVRYGLADYLVAKWGLVGRLGFRASEYQLRFADAIIAVTPALADRLRSRGITRNIHVIGNALDERSAYSEDSDLALPAERYVLAVGRVTAQKNLIKLIEGFKLFAEGRDGVVLALAGGLDDEEYLNEIEPLVDSRIKLLGRLPRSSLGRLYANAHLYVNSSIHEGASNAVLEAISWEAPILLSDIPENRDFGVKDGHYFDPHEPQAIAAALARAFDDRDVYIADRSAFMTWDEVAEKTAAIYRSFGLSAAPTDASAQS